MNRTSCTCGCPHAECKQTGGLAIDRAALRRALGGRDEWIEPLEKKRSGRPGANVARLWAFLTASLYTSGDLPVLATREALQNSRDSLLAARRARTGHPSRFEVTWDPDARSLTWADTGVGMDTETIFGKFLTLGESGKSSAESSEDAAGGFGVAKAVILGVAGEGRWELHTRDNRAVSQGTDGDIDVFDAPYLDGCRLTVFDVPERFDTFWDRSRGERIPMLDRLRELLAANDLPGIELILNEEPVAPMFSRRGGSVVALDAAWGSGTTVAIKAHRRPPGDRAGAYYVRLGGLFQFRVPAQRGNLKADVVVDLRSTTRPGTPGYPLNAARDALQGPAAWAASDLIDLVERENESTGRNHEDMVFDPDSEDDDERDGARALHAQAEAVAHDPAFQRALADAAGGLVDFYAARARDPGVDTPVTSLAPPGSRPAETGATRPIPIPADVASVVAVADDIASPESPAVRLGRMLAAAEGDDDDDERTLIVTPPVRAALDRLATGLALDDRQVAAVSDAVDRAAEVAMEPGRGGLVAAGGLVAEADRALATSSPRARPKNPFGRLAGLRISRKHYDRRRAARFRETFARWMPHLTAWDATLRLVATEARIARAFKPGFILDDELLGLTTASSRGSAVVYLHPDRFAQVIKAHPQRPLAIAAYLHGVAVHELTHLDGRMGLGHDESYVSAREDLGHATSHLLPAIAILVEKLLGLEIPPTEEQRSLVRAQRQLERLRAQSADTRALRGRLAKTEALLAQARSQSELARRSATTACGCDGHARRLDRVVEILATRPPSGFTPDEVRAFAVRQHPNLLALLRQVHR